MPRRNRTTAPAEIHGSLDPQVYRVTLRDGTTADLTIRPDGADFSAHRICHQCGGHAAKAGGFSGGMLPVFETGLYLCSRWLPCGACVFGAARRRALGGHFWEDHPNALRGLTINELHWLDCTPGWTLLERAQAIRIAAVRDRCLQVIEGAFAEEQYQP